MTQPFTEDDSLLVTVKEAARLLAVSEWTIRSLMKKNVLKRVEIESAVRVRRSDLERLANTQEPWNGMRFMREESAGGGEGGQQPTS